VPLPADIGSDAFNSAYLAALAGQSEAKGRARSVHARGSIAALIASYLCSAGYRSLRQTTKSGYASRIEVLRTQHGHRTIQGLTRERIVAVLQPYAARPGAALSILKMLRVLIRHAIDIGWLKYDPSSGIRRPKTQEIRSWSDTEIEAFEHRWPVGAKQRLAFALLLYTGQRRSDVHRMTWADVSGRTIRVVQQKTGRKLAIPLHSELLAALLAADRDHVTIINTEYGKPFTVLVSVNGCAQRLPRLASRSNVNPMGSAKPLAGGSQRPDAPLMKSCRYSDIGRSPKPSVTRVTPIKRGSRQTLFQNWKDTRRTNLPKPMRAVWEERQKQKKNQSEQMATGAS